MPCRSLHWLFIPRGTLGVPAVATLPERRVASSTETEVPVRPCGGGASVFFFSPFSPSPKPKPPVPPFPKKCEIHYLPPPPPPDTPPGPPISLPTHTPPPR